MNRKIFTPRFVFIVSMILIAAIMRLLPHWPNFTPVAAMALFGGVYFSRRYLAFLIPIVAMLLSDLVIGMHNTMIAVYIAFCITVGIGILISRRPKALHIAGGALTSTMLFFLITNFAAWLGNPLYSQTLAGLAQSYAAGLVFLNDGSYGISFFMNSVLGDLFYTAVFFGVFYLARLKFPVLAYR